MTPPVVVLTRALAPLHPPGGLERAVFEQVRHLHAAGLALTVVTQPPLVAPPPPALAGVAWRFVRYGALPLRRNSVPDRLLNYPLFVARVARLARVAGWPPGTLVHAHGLLAAAAPATYPLVYAPHGLEEFSRADPRKTLAYAPIRLALRRAAGRAAAVLATDTGMAPGVAATLRVPPARVQVIPNGVSLAALDSLADPARQRELTARLALAACPLRLVSCARLERNKGLHVAVAALARARATLPPGWRWWIVGRGQEEARLRQQIARAGLAGQIHLLGALDDPTLHNLLPLMHLFLTPSLYEGSSIATLEAMAHRLPVLATTVGGLPDKVLPGRTGYLAPPDDPAALADALRAATADRGAWPSLGAAGRGLVQAAFDWPAIAARLIDLYRSLTDGGYPA